MAMIGFRVERVPERDDGPLFHYTSLAGSFGIANDKAILATDASFLSDLSEFAYGKSLLLRAVEELQAKVSGHQKDILEQFNSFLTRGSLKSVQTFVASFSTHGDLLSQWRGYAPPDAGVSLGFAGAKLEALATTQGFRLVRCVYDSGTHNAIVSEIIDIALRATRNDEGEPDRSYWEYFADRNAEFVSNILRIKHPAFEAEQEYRLISAPKEFFGTDKILYRVGASTVIPYVTFELPTVTLPNLKEGVDEVWLDVAEAVVGPSRRQ